LPLTRINKMKILKLKNAYEKAYNRGYDTAWSNIIYFLKRQNFDECVKLLEKFYTDHPHIRELKDII
jgi:hypothetical protein